MNESNGSLKVEGRAAYNRLFFSKSSMYSIFEKYRTTRNVSSMISLHYLALQVEACGAVAGDGEDEGLWGLPRAEVLFGDGEAERDALGGGGADGSEGHAVAQRGNGDGGRIDGSDLGIHRAGEGVGFQINDQ